MTLVGLGADARATRMVGFLAKQGLPIAMLTFRCYKHGDQVFLAKQVQVERDVAERARGQSSSTENKKRWESDLEKNVADFRIRDFWEDVVDAFDGNTSIKKDGFNFEPKYRLYLPDHKTGFHAYLSVLLKPEGKVRIIFFPASIHLCLDDFEQSKVSFEREPTKNAPPTNKIQEQWFVDVDGTKWKDHKEELVTLAGAVYKAWHEERKRRMSEKAADIEGGDVRTA